MDPLPLSSLESEIYQRRKKNIFDFYRMKVLNKDLRRNTQV